MESFPTPEWHKKASCRGSSKVPAFGDMTTVEMTAFINAYCMRCPVAQECLDSALNLGDIEWTVAGGYLPFMSSARTRGRPATTGTSQRQLELRVEWQESHVGRPGRTACTNGHKMTDETAYYKRRGTRPGIERSCAQCNNDKQARYAKKNKKGRRQNLVGGNCVKGKHFIESQEDLREREIGDRLSYSCIACDKIRTDLKNANAKLSA